MKTRFLLTSLVILFCWTGNAALSQDIIILTIGDEIKARVSEIGSTDIKYKKFENLTGPTYTMLKSDVFEIKYENGTKDIFTLSKTTPSVQVTIASDSIKVQKPVVAISKPKKGSIKIYSELKKIDVYLDDVYEGTDIITIDSVASGSHYFKAVKDEVTVYGSLMTINDNAITTVLINNSKEVKEKLLAAKYKEQQLYKSQKLDVMIDTKYITQTGGSTYSSYYPGYGSGLYGYSNTSSTAVTYASKVWFFTQGGNKKITEKEFATLTKNQRVIDIINNTEKKVNTANSVGGGFLIVGVLSTLVGLKTVIDPPGVSHNEDVNVGLFLGGLIAAGIGYLIMETTTAPTHYYDFDYAISQAKLYNQNLKTKLGLPEDFEPKE